MLHKGKQMRFPSFRRQFSVRTLLLVLAGAALTFGVVVAKYRTQNVAIEDLMDRDVFIATEPIGPRWLASLAQTDRFLVRPIQAQVLVSPGDDGQITFNGKQHQLSQARQGLLTLREHLSSKLGLQGFCMVVDFQDHQLRMNTRFLSDLNELSDEVGSLVTPCGIGNFRPREQQPNNG